MTSKSTHRPTGAFGAMFEVTTLSSHPPNAVKDVARQVMIHFTEFSLLPFKQKEPLPILR